MNGRFAVRAIALVGLVAGLYGCGTSVGNPNGMSVAVDSQSCIDCHAKGKHDSPSVSKGTGDIIVSEWTNSKHSIKNVAGCKDCHEVGVPHGGGNNCSTCHGGTSARPVVSDLKCYKCHDAGMVKALGKNHLPSPNPGSNWVLNSSNRFDRYTSAGYISLRGTAYETRCNACHNPHENTITPQHLEWAESGHGEATAGPWNGTDFKARGTIGREHPANFTDECIRCHTTTGYINFVASGFKNVEPWGKGSDGKSIGPTKQVLYCSACHSNAENRSYGYGMRIVNKVRLYFNYSSAPGSKNTSGTFNPSYDNTTSTFTRVRLVGVAANVVDIDDLGISNRCVVCHSGRGKGEIIKSFASLNDIVTGTPFNYNKVAAYSAHDFVGGGVLFQKIAYEYAGRSYVNSGFAHDKIGINDFSRTGTNGPCVTCHMDSPESHSFKPTKVSLGGTTYANLNTEPNLQVTEIVSRACSKCHTSGRIGYSKFNIIDLPTLNQKRSYYRYSIDALMDAHKKRGTANTANRFTNSWEHVGTCGPGTGADAMGAAYNHGLLTQDPGGFVHNEEYVKRLLYDSIDFLDDCSLNYSVGSSLDGAGSGSDLSGATYTPATKAYILKSGVTTGSATERP